LEWRLRTFWFNDPGRNLVAIAMTQVSDIVFNGTMTEFAKLAIDSENKGRPSNEFHVKRSHRSRGRDRKRSQGQWGGKTGGVGQYADVNGINLYYETQGTGYPLILLHGGLGAGRCSAPTCRRS